MKKVIAYKVLGGLCVENHKEAVTRSREFVLRAMLRLRDDIDFLTSHPDETGARLKILTSTRFTQVQELLACVEDLAKNKEKYQVISYKTLYGDRFYEESAAKVHAKKIYGEALDRYRDRIKRIVEEGKLDSLPLITSKDIKILRDLVALHDDSRT